MAFTGRGACGPTVPFPCTVDAQQLGPIVASRERLWLHLCAEAAPDWRTCACTGRRDGGPRCLWCGLMGRTGERVPQLCVSRIFDGRKPEEGTVKGKEKMGSMEKGGLIKTDQIIIKQRCEEQCRLFITAAVWRLLLVHHSAS